MKNNIQILFLSLLLFACNAGLAQTKTKVSGVVLDSVRTPLVGASVMLMHEQDSLLEGFAIVDSEGKFDLVAKTAGEYILQITFIGYGMFARHLTVSDNSPEIDLEEIILNPDAVLLEGATVTAEFIPILFKGDTVEYNANAFQTHEGALVEDLLKKLPGVEVDKDGKITAHGEEVQNILIDGKQFFEDDPKIASQNIPADIVDKVQIFDKASDFSAFTGIDDGREEKTINLSIKDGKSKGTFGNLKAGYGTEERYAGGLNINRFNSKMQLSGIGNVNNLNEQPFSTRDYFEFMGGMSEMMRGGEVDMNSVPVNLLNNTGLTDAFSGGLNFNYDFNKKTSIRSNYFTSYSDNVTNAQTNFINAGEGSLFENRTESNEEATLLNHRFRINLHHKFNAGEDFKINLKGALNDSEIESVSNSKSLTGDELPVNKAVTENYNFSDDLSWQAEAVYRKKMAKRGRFFTAEASVGNRSAGRDQFIENQTEFLVGEPKIDSLDQYQEESTNNPAYNVKLDYVEPLATFQYLNFSLERGNDYTEREKLFSDRTGSGYFEENDDLSGGFERSFTHSSGGIGYRFIKEKIRFSLGAEYRLIDLENDDFRNGSTLLEKSFANLLPNAGFNYQIDKNTRLMARYTTQVQVPSVEELQPVFQNTDPLNIYTGNPDLEAAYMHRLDFRYSYFNMFYFRSLFFGGNIGFTDNAIVDGITVDENLVRTVKPINSGNEFSANGFFDFKTPISGADLKVGTGGNGNYTVFNSLINNRLERIRNLNWSQNIELENKGKDRVDLLAGYRVGVNRTRYEMNTDWNQTYLNHDFYGSLIWTLPKSWMVELDYEHQLFDENDFFSRTSFDFLDASVSKSFLKNKITISLEAKNLFDENRKVDRTGFGNQFFEKTTNKLGRIFMLRATYKIRSFGK